MKNSALRKLLLPAAICLTPAVAWANDAAGGGAEDASLTHRMMLLAIQLGVIIFVARLGNILFERLKLPGVLGELLAGTLVGAYTLGHIPFYGFPHGLFPAHGDFPVSPELYRISSLAAIVLLFDVGLETDIKLMLRYCVAGGLVGIGGVVASFAFGIGVTMLMADYVFGHPVGPLHPVCLFLGTASTATSVGITARILSEKRRLDSPEGVTILSAAVIDDVIGMIVLAVVLGLISASSSGSVDWGHIGVIAIKAVGVWLSATVIGLVASRKISFLLKWFGDRTAIATMALALALVLAGLFEEAGLAMIIGAYVMGLSLSRSDISHVVREKLHPVFALLVPVFFATTGMLIDVAALGSTRVLVFGLAYTATALAAKLLGCGLPALLANFNLRGALRIGAGMAPRGEVGLIIAGIGVLAGILNSELFAAVIIMVVVNTILAPPVLVALFRSDKRGTRKPVEGDEPEETLTFEFPSFEMAEFFIRKLTDVLEGEGFFVHQLSRERRLYQLRKDRTVIDFHHTGKELHFSCNRHEVHFVNTAMYEAMAALEESIRGLKKPLDAKAFQARIQDSGPLGPQMLNMRHFLTPGLVEPKLRGKTKAEVIDELLNVLKRQGQLHDVDTARAAVWKREESMPTGLQYGVAIPHGKTDAVSRLVCAVGVKRGGVDFDAMDGEPSSIIILTLSPESKPAPHVQFMSTISQILNTEGRRRILDARGAHQVYRVFTGPIPAAAPAAPAAPPARGVKFQLADYLRPELLEPNLSGTHKREIIIELLTLLEGAGLLRDAVHAAETVLAREETMSTGMEDGVAIPHGRTDAVDSLVCAVGVKRDGIEFNAADGKPSQIFVLVLTPEGGADPYLQFVASVMTALDADGRRRVLGARTPQELRDALTHGGA